MNTCAADRAAPALISSALRIFEAPVDWLVIALAMDVPTRACPPIVYRIPGDRAMAARTRHADTCWEGHEGYAGLDQDFRHLLRAATFMRGRVPVTVYLCDDVPELRQLMRAVLKEGGAIEVIGEAGDAATGIEEIATLRPRIVLLDLSMPGMDGLEALPRIKDVVPDAGVIVFSGFIAARMEGAALASGADRYVEKGSPLAELRTMVLELAEELDADAR